MAHSTAFFAPLSVVKVTSPEMMTKKSNAGEFSSSILMHNLYMIMCDNDQRTRVSQTTEPGGKT